MIFYKTTAGNHIVTTGANPQIPDYFNQVRIYNRALTAAEIEKLYLADKPRYGGL